MNSGWRIVVISKTCKLSYKNGYLLVRGEEIISIHLSEISVLIIESTQVSITTILLAELTRMKIKTIFCNEYHNPDSELMPYDSRYDSSGRIMKQIDWKAELKVSIADNIIKQKIRNQARLLGKYELHEGEAILKDYLENYTPNDMTNREAHAAKVYFKELFGESFCREQICNINAKLNYGYTILLSIINREIVSNGCLTQLGIKHHSIHNPYNLSSDIIEPWRVVVDEYVYLNKDLELDSEIKHEIVGLLNKKVLMQKDYYLSNAIRISVKSIIEALDNCEESKMVLYEFA